MKIDLFDIDEFVELNGLQEVTSGVLFQRNNVKHPDGLISDEIFGVTVRDRKNTFAYIDLHGKFFHPHVYKVLLRLYRNVDKIIDGSLYVSLDKDGHIVKDDEAGETGIDFLINNWKKINWDQTDESNMRNERINLMHLSPKKIFVDKFLVIPAFYRDVNGGYNSGASRSEVNTFYANLIRLSSMLKEDGIFTFKLHSCNMGIQNNLVSIYDYFQNAIKKKNGIIRKYLMGKNVDFCTREVITAPSFQASRPEDIITDLRHCGIPISSVMALLQPFILKWLKDFFEREVISKSQSGYETHSGNLVYFDHPEDTYNEKFYLHMINTFVRDPESRFNTFPIKIRDSNKPIYAMFQGKQLVSGTKNVDTTIPTRYLTWTDVLYMAAADVTKDKNVIITRYPIVDEYNMFAAHIRVLSTTKTTPMIVNGVIYKWYPVIDFDVPKERLAMYFIDAMKYSNSHLKGQNGDYDGDQITAKIPFTKEANEELDKFIDSPSYFINTGGNNIRIIESEAVQTFFTLTKDPKNDAKDVPAEVVEDLLNCPQSELTFEKLVSLFAMTSNTSISDNKTNRIPPRFKCYDKLTIPKGRFGNDNPIQSTIGRLIFNRILYESSGIIEKNGYVNKLCNAGAFKDIEAKITNLLKSGDITAEQFTTYVNSRDWLGLQLHVVITTSYSPEVLRTPKEVVALKKQLIKKYDKELKEGNCEVSEMIEDALVKKTVEALGDDYGLDLFISGARGSLGNNYKNTNLWRGAVKNHATGKYDIIENSLMEGLDKNMIPAHCNSCVTGAYSKSCSTAEPGYYAKEMAQAMQSEVLDPDANSDCGTNKYLKVTIDKPSNYEYRYIKEGNKLKCLTLDIINNYKGKTVMMRSPMYCTRTKSGKVCSRCAGQLFYKLNKMYVGLLSTRVASMCTELCMKKFHDASVKVAQIDLDTMFL